MRADQLNEFDKKDFQDNEAHNLHSENAVEIAKAFGTPEEVEAMERIMDQHMRRGHILPNEVEERNALVRKYYSMLEHSVNPTFKSTLEGYKVLPPMDKEKYQARDGLEGPFSTLSGKVVYYDPKEGSYYDPDTDMYISYDDFQALDNDYSGMGDEEADDFVKDIEPKETVEESDQGFSGKERNFIYDLCMMHDGVKRDPAGLKYLGTSEMWDEGNVLSDKGKLTTLMLWANKNKDVVEKRFSRMFNNYSNKDENGKVTASDGNQMLNDIINKIGSIGEQTVKGPRGHLRSIVADDLNEIDCWDGYRKDGTKPGTGKNKGKRVNNCVKEAGGYYTQPIYDMIEQHGYEKVMHELLTSLDADVIQDFISRADLDETDLNEFGPDERYMKVGNNTMIANKKTGSVSSTLSLGGDKSATVNNHLNRDGSMGKVSARGTVNVAGTPVKFKGSNNISGNNFKGSVSAGGMTVNASKKPKMKKEGKYVSDAQRKAVHASKAEKK